MRLATWNVNSIRSRVDRVISFLERTNTDVLAMQEIKCRPEQFPIEAFGAAGYLVAAHGLDQWNGVAIASRVGLSDVETAFPGQPPYGKAGSESVLEARALGASCGGIRVWSIYIPNGRALGDPHFIYKLAFLSALQESAERWILDGAPVAVAGDWNVAPLDTDIWDASEPEVATHVSPEVRDAFFAFERAGYEEISRRFLPEEHHYTFWDYQRLRFPRGEGMRIDHVFASPTLAARATAATIDREERKGAGASDHAPVIVDFSDGPGSVVS
jgi:exodeoxyribonuclease-3